MGRPPQRTDGPDPGVGVKVPDQIDVQRAREILEELRRRLGEPTRPMLELEYLERLLKRFRKGGLAQLAQKSPRAQRCPVQGRGPDCLRPNAPQGS